MNSQRIVAERVAVRLLHGTTDRGPNVGEEQRRADMSGKLAQILVVPRGLDTPVNAWRLRRPIPADPEPVIAYPFDSSSWGLSVERR
jgi:hypothetical protein